MAKRKLETASNVAQTDTTITDDEISAVFAINQTTDKPEYIDLNQYSIDTFFSHQTQITENMHIISHLLKELLGPEPTDPAYKIQSFSDVFGNTWMDIMDLAWNQWKFTEAAKLYDEVYNLIAIFQRLSPEDKLVVYNILQQVYNIKHDETIDLLQWMFPIEFFIKTLKERLPNYFS